MSASRRVTFTCPCCAHALVIRTSDKAAPCFKNLYYQCTNLVCGATFNGHQTINQQLSPSGVERPLIQLPLAPALERTKAMRAMQGDDYQPDLLDQLEAHA